MGSSLPPIIEAIWRVADPKITLASAAGLLLGSAAALRDGPLDWSWLLVSWLGIFFLEAAKNASGEVFDFYSGADTLVAPQDRSPFSGGKRVIVDDLLTTRQTGRLAAILYAVGIGLGLSIAVWREPVVLWLGLAGVALAFFYQAPPVRLSYRGFGELAVATVYGPLVVSGAYLVQRHSLPFEVIVLSLPLGLAVGSFLWINEFPDAEADRLAGKRTWVVRLGRNRASRLFGWIVAAEFTLLAVFPFTGAPAGIWLGFAALPTAILAAIRLRRSPARTDRIIAAQEQTLTTFVLLAVGMSIGLHL